MSAPKPATASEAAERAAQVLRDCETVVDASPLEIITYALALERRTALAEVERKVAERVASAQRWFAAETNDSAKTRAFGCHQEALAILALVRDLAKEQAG